MKCPFCEMELEVTEEFAGLVVQCPGCSDFFKVRDMQKCPVCGDSSFEPRQLCVKCGYDFASGTQLNTRNMGEELQLTPAQKFAVFLYDNCSGLFRAPTLIGFFLCLAVGAVIAYFGVLFMLMGAMTGFFVVAAGWMVYIQGVAFICAGEVTFLRNACVDMTGNCWYTFVVLSLLPLILGLAAMGLLRPAK